MEILEAGIRLIELESGVGDPLLGRWVSRSAVTTEVNRLRRESGIEPVSDFSYRDRWPDDDDYVRDIIAYALYKGYTDHRRVLAEAGHGNLLEAEDFVRAVQDTVFADLTSEGGLIAMNMQLIITTLARNSESAQAALQGLYKVVGETWMPVYEKVFKALGKELRPDVSLEEFAYCMTAAAEGLLLRRIADPSCPIINYEKQTSLLGTMALAMFVACLDHDGDGLSLEDLARSMRQSSRSARGSQ